jgi:adenylate cyclase
VDVPQVARQLKVSHVLEGSVRNAGGRVRITAQLIDGASGEHVWAERYDRDLNDIFALQDEISEAIVKALKLKLLPQEKRAIEQRGTTDAEAYKYYLLYFDSQVEDGLKEAEQALALDPNLAEAHAAKARVLNLRARYPEARVEIDRALALDPDSYEGNREAAIYAAAMHDNAGAIRHFEKAAELNEHEYYAAGMAIGFYSAAGDVEGKKSAAQRALTRVEKLLVNEPDHGSALAFGVAALMGLGEAERGREWIERALLVDPDNINMRYNLACSLIAEAGAVEEGLDLLASVMERVQQASINWMKVDPDLNKVREHPRFKAMIAAAEARLAAEGKDGAQ